MSDQQPTNPPADEPEITGGWQRPAAAGGWRPAEPSATDAEESSGGWQVVKAMPPELDVIPSDEGVWHRPRPEDTTFDPEDELEISPRQESITFPELTRPEDMMSAAASALAQTPVDSEDEDEEDESDDLEAFSGLSELVALVSLVDRQPQPSILLRDEAAEEEPQDAADAIEAALAAAQGRRPAEEEEPDFSGRAMAEREALSQATGADVPRVPLTGLRYDEEAEEEDDSPAAYARRQLEQLAEAEAEEVVESDAEAYARQQLEQLGEDSQDLQPTEILDSTGPTDESPAAAYARQQLEQLGGVQAAEPVDEEREALAQKFVDTEAQVRALRARHQNGQITREELQTELRKLLILDDEQQWWMMGVDTDNWYRYDNSAGEWLPDTPPRPTPRRGLPTETSGLSPVEVLGGRALPYLDDQEVTEYDTFDPERSEGMRLRSVPITDPEATIPGAGGVYMDTVRRSEAETLQSTQPASADVTVPHDPFAPDAGAYIPAPGEEDIPPDYQIGISGLDVEEARAEQRRLLLRRGLLAGSLVLGSLFIIGTIFVLYVVVTYNNIASEYRDAVIGLASYEPPFQTARILDSQGGLLAELTSQTGGDRKRLNSLAQVSPELIYAIVALEDPRYFEHPGFDPLAIGRAFIQNLGAGTVVSGASTITQQIASALILQDSTPTAENKLREIIIASEIAQRYSKNEILLLYLNEIFLGNQSYGVEAAAEFYYQKTANQVNLTEGAMLASLIAAPATRDPVTNRATAFAQADNALRQIAQVPCLNFSEVPGVNRQFCIDRSTILNAQGNFAGRILVERAQLQARDYLPRRTEIDHPHFVFFVLAQLERDFGSDEIFRRGFVVRTTLHRAVQDAAEESLRGRVQALAATGVNTGAVMVTDPASGAIRAMVGSPDFNNPDIAGQVNNTLTWQQPGSTIKPILYTKALEGFDRNGNGVLEFNEYLTAASVLWDVPSQYTNPPYNPVNFDGRYRGPVAVRYALANSLNVPAVKAFDFIGPEQFVEISRRMGLAFESDGRGEAPTVGRPSALGATDVRLYDMMHAYGVLANTGNFMPLYAIESITDSAGNTVPVRDRPAPERRVAAPIAFLLQNILSDDAARADTFGRNSVLNIPQYPGRVAAKTGTTDQNRDLWTIGFSRNAVVGVWLGSVQDTPTRASSLEAARVWNETMMAALSARGAPQGFESPGNIAQQTICTLTGTLPAGNCPSRRNELFVASQPPPPPEQGPVVQVPIDTWSLQRANDVCPENVELRTFVNIGDPFAIPWLRSASGQQTAQLLGLPQNIEAPPAAACDVNTILPTAVIASPQDTQVVENVVQITGAAAAPNFARYQIELAPINTNNFALIAGPFTNPQPNMGTVLAEWDTRAVANGDYTLRLSMFATAESGGGFLHRTARVRVNNIPPTPTPTMTPTITPIPTETTIPVFPTQDFPTLTPMPAFPTATTLPMFETDTPAAPVPLPGESQGLPGGATPTISLGG